MFPFLSFLFFAGALLTQCVALGCYVGPPLPDKHTESGSEAGESAGGDDALDEEVGASWTIQEGSMEIPSHE